MRGWPCGGLAAAYLSLLVLIPLAAVVWTSTAEGWAGFREAVTSPEAVSTLKLTLACSPLVVVINAISGTLIAWVLVRDKFVGKSLVNSIIDMPFALPTIVAGLTLLALYGPLGRRASTSPTRARPSWLRCCS